MASSDPPPTLVLAVTGHRDLTSPSGVRAKLDELFALIGQAKIAGQASLRVVSPLAEGADRLFCEAGLDVGAGLHCPLPFGRKEYLKDFKKAASRAAFNALLAKADRVLELDGDPKRRDAAYVAVGRLVASRCDLLVAIWDGEPIRGRGGTAEVVAEALSQGVLVVQVDPSGEQPTVMLEGDIRPVRRPIDGLGEQLDRILSGPVRTNLKREPAKAALEASRARWIGLLPAQAALNSVCGPCTEGGIISTFARADSLATHFAGLYRRAYWLNFLLGALAVGMALVGARDERFIFPLIEFFAIITIIVSTAAASRRHWHEHWIECRHLAEQLRPVRFLFPLGLGLPRSHAGLTGQGEGSTAWDDWLVRRIDVTLGFPNAVVTPDYVEAVRQFVLTDVLPDQIRYHTGKAKRTKRTDWVMHWLGLAMFATSAAVCFIEVITLGSHAHFEAVEAIRPAFMVIAGLAPAVGGGVLGVRNVAEYERLEKRSKAMAEALERFRRLLAEKHPDGFQYEWISRRLEELAALMMSETADWRTLVITRRIELVG